MAVEVVVVVLVVVVVVVVALPIYLIKDHGIFSMVIILIILTTLCRKIFYKSL